MASGPPVDAPVKWFNAEKGFGFVELGDGTGDAFLHIGVVQAAGHDSVLPETKMKVQVGQGQKGRQVTSVLELDASTGNAAGGQRSGGPGGVGGDRPRFGGGDRGDRGGYGGGGGGGGFGGGAPRRSDRERADPSTAVPLDGAVKWFKTDKGFGFVGADDGGKDVFVHISVLERAGLSQLADGQRVSMQVVTTQKGREAISIQLG